MKPGTRIQFVLRLKPGDVVAIPLTAQLFAFARVYRPATLGILDVRSPHLLSLEALAECGVESYRGFFCTPKQRTDLDWLYLGQIPFSSEDDEWSPPSFSRDMLRPEQFNVFHKGKTWTATQDQLEGFQHASLHSPKALREGLLHGFPDHLAEYFKRLTKNDVT